MEGIMAGARSPVARRSHLKLRRRIPQACVYVLVTVGACLCLFPFYWMVVVSTRPSGEVFSFPPPIAPGTLLLHNIHSLFEALPYGRNYVNSIVYATSVTVLMLFFDTLAGFAFAKYEFPGRDLLFTMLLTTMMIPYSVTLIPWFIEMKWFGWINSYAALIIPNVVDAFGIFWMRQYIAGSVPSELIDAARIDGSSDFGIYHRIVVHIASPAMGALGILTFLGAWNNLVGPLIIFSDPKLFTITVALRTLVGLRLTDYGALMAGTTLAIIPILVIYLAGARRFIAGITAGSL
ncbi:MAG: carbohydrate ABC transporter permease, partial [Anaerolineae bacterium]